jgi:hypothetical protein
MGNNCAFQYVEMEKGMFASKIIVCDRANLTLNEAKELWNQYYPRAAKHIYHDGKVNMVIWINMVDSSHHFDFLHHIGTDAESDGITIWKTKKTFFPQEIKIKP